MSKSLTVRETHLLTVRFRMMLETDAIFAKLHADLHPGFLSRLLTFNWARHTERAILEALDISTDATTAHARVLVAHGESVYNGLRLLESIAGDISNLLASEEAAIEQEIEEIEARFSTIFGGHCGAKRILKGRVAELHRISQFWMEAGVSWSQGIHAFNGVQSDLTALSEHQPGPKTARLHLPADKQGLNLKGWVRRLDARRVLMSAQVSILLVSHSLSDRVLCFRSMVYEVIIQSHAARYAEIFDHDRYYSNTLVITHDPSVDVNPEYVVLPPGRCVRNRMACRRSHG